MTMSFRPGPRLAAPVLYQFHMTGAAPSRHKVIIKGEAFQVRPAAPSKADVALHCDAETSLLFLYGRVPAARGVTAEAAWPLTETWAWWQGSNNGSGASERPC